MKYTTSRDTGAIEKLIDLGAECAARDRLVEAEAMFRDAIALDPAFAEAHFKLGNLLKRQGKLQEAISCFRQAILVAPDYIKAYYNLANTLGDLSFVSEAEATYQRVLELDPTYTDAQINLGSIYFDRKRFSDAEACYRRALELEPGDPITLNNLGLALMAQGRASEAENCFRNVFEKDSSNAEAHNNLGLVLKELGRLDEAEDHIRTALAIHPRNTDTLNNLGIVLKAQDRLIEAESAYGEALAINDRATSVLNNLGIVFKAQGRLSDAEATYRKALTFAPDSAEMLNNLGGILADQGRSTEAADFFERAVARRNDFTDAHSNLLFALNYCGTRTIAARLEEARRYGKTVTKLATEHFPTWLTDPTPKRLRVGLVSADLRNHPVGFFLDGVLEKIDTNKVELIAYANHRFMDETSTQLARYCMSWRTIADRSVPDIANLIHADGVHVLIDLSGHTTGNRLPVFAWKPAPVQVSWLGYFSTTGVAEIAYILADKVGVPDQDEKQFTESVWYLPETRLCFTAPKFEVPVSELPAVANGFITFGSFQNLAKISCATLGLWGQILGSLPDSRLHIRHPHLEIEDVKQKLLARLRQNRIAETRVILSGGLDRKSYLAAYHDIDIVLDTFPYPGGTTTCEALWMGVPTLTLAGTTMLQRQGASLLTAAGLLDWVATSEEAYISKAIHFARNLNELALLRRTLRKRVTESPLFDTQRFATNLVDALWQMWERFSRSCGNPGNST